MPEIILVEQPLSLEGIKKIAKQSFGDMIKAVVDIEKNIMAVGGELHADEEAFLIERGSSQKNLWGINIYIDKNLSERVEFDSMINIRPSQNNRSRSVEDTATREKIQKIASSLMK